ncbi:hypothetical protein GTR02_09685 [Kineococcus sp. R8]|uniref:hypothetical protein n=1 Tax=Kineococcus siccus TaxID=2696567 RepID=UPI0014120810|nr:hypothetical protein [Kineococcus siccus]NAZ82087.1 hypothetical protein [Kineococcus siccus]
MITQSTDTTPLAATRRRAVSALLDVRLVDATTSRPRLQLRDGAGLVESLVVRPESLPDVRSHLDDAGPDTACDLELLDADEGLAARWGHFAHAGQAAAVGAALLGADRTLSGARVTGCHGDERGRELLRVHFHRMPLDLWP